MLKTFLIKKNFKLLNYSEIESLYKNQIQIFW